MCSSCNGTVIARKWWVQTLRWCDTSSEMSPAPSVLAQRVATFRRPADARQKKKERPTIQLGHIFHLASRAPCPEFPSSTWVNGDWRAILRRRLVDSQKIDSGRIREIWWEKQPSWKVGGEKKRQLIRDTKEKRRLARIITETRMCNPFPQPAAHRSGASKVSAL